MNLPSTIFPSGYSFGGNAGIIAQKAVACLWDMPTNNDTYLPN